MLPPYLPPEQSMSDVALDVVDLLYNPLGLEDRVQKRIAELRTLKSQYENTVEQARAAEMSMKNERRRAAQDLLRAEEIMKTATDLMEKAQKQYAAVSIQETNARDLQRQLDEKQQHLDHREQLIDLKQAKLDQTMKQLKEQLV
jgi:hypothetical protein